MLLLLLLSARSYSTPPPELNINTIDTGPVGKWVEIFVEQEGKGLSYDDMLLIEDTSWIKSEKAVPNLGYQQSAVWFKFKVKNSLEIDEEAIEDFHIRLTAPLLDHIELYIVRPNEPLEFYITGDHYPITQKPIWHNFFLFPLNLKLDQQATIYVRVESTSSTTLPMTIETLESSKKTDWIWLILNNIFYGTLIMVLLLHFLIYFSLKETIDVIYIGFIASFLATQAILQGTPWQIFWPEMPWIQDGFLLVFNSCIIIFMSYFTRLFLNLKNKFPLLDGLFKTYIGIASGVIAMIPFFSFQVVIQASIVLTIIAALTCFLTGPLLWLQGMKIARFYTAAWSVITLGALVFIFGRIGIINTTFLTENILTVGSIMQAVFLTMALADRINLEKEKRAEIQTNLLQEMEERQKMEADFLYAASHHPITTKPNLAFLEQWYSNHKEDKEKSDNRLALLLIGLTEYYEIHQTLGPVHSEQVIAEFGNVVEAAGTNLSGVITMSDNYDRLHTATSIDDHTFAMLVEYDDEYELQARLLLMSKILQQPFEFKGMALSLGVTIGVAYFSEEKDSIRELVRLARISIDVAKDHKKRVMIYSDEINPYNRRRLTLMADLRKAINNGSLEQFYQVQYCFKNERVIAIEALIRWKHPEHGKVSPDEFIPIAETTGDINLLTYWVLENAIRRLAELSLYGQDIAIAVNISTVNLKQLTFPDRVKGILEKYSIDRSKLVLEVTETAVMDDPSQSLYVLNQLSQLGIKLSLDDFGTGHASFTYLKELPVNELKIDKSFVADMIENEDDAILVRTAINMAHDLGLEVVAEGIENEEILERLKEYGCDYVQGYYLSKPLPFDLLIEMLDNGFNLPSKLPQRKV